MSASIQTEEAHVIPVYLEVAREDTLWGFHSKGERGWDTLRRNFRWNGRPGLNIVGARKLEGLAFDKVS